jgi:predicted MPP superfamily phosphohydrolase
MPIPGLPPALVGLRIAHLTDLHVSDRVPLDYIRGVVRQVNRLKPDLAFVTGDLVTQGEGWIDEACQAVAELEAPTYVSLGNHDYGEQNYRGQTVDVAKAIETRLAAAGCLVLRNKAVYRDGLCIMGLEDLWSGRFAPAQAFAGVDRATPVLALSHNPDTGAALGQYGAAWVFAGHTHGGQIRLPGLGALLLPVQNERLQKGLSSIGAGRMYISRGVGFLAPLRFCCRPEVPIFVADTA